MIQLRGSVRLVLAAALLCPAGCGEAEPARVPAATNASTPAAANERGSTLTIIELVAGSRRWTWRMDDTPTARDFLAQLPLKLTLTDFGGNECSAECAKCRDNRAEIIGNQRQNTFNKRCE